MRRFWQTRRGIMDLVHTATSLATVVMLIVVVMLLRVVQRQTGTITVQAATAESQAQTIDRMHTAMAKHNRKALETRGAWMQAMHDWGGQVARKIETSEPPIPPPLERFPEEDITSQQ